MTERLTFFWSHREDAPHCECSQFYPSPMIIDGVAFGCGEQWMHWRKALLFGDVTTARAILAEPDPARQKALGRQVAGFLRDFWRSVARDIVVRGTIAKFSQSPDLLARLRATSGTTLVEASPNDAIWGIGLAHDDPRALRRDAWRGTNWLGAALTEVRRALCGA